MNKKIIALFAEYSVAPVIGCLFAVSLGKGFSEALVLFFSGALLTTIGVGIGKSLKLLIRKNRPPKSVEYFKSYETYAFPSTHAAGVTTLSFFIFLQDARIGGIALAFAFTTIVARVLARVHDFYDVCAGVILGITVGYFLYEPVVRYAYYLSEMFL